MTPFVSRRATATVSLPFLLAERPVAQLLLLPLAIAFGGCSHAGGEASLLPDGGTRPSACDTDEDCEGLSVCIDEVCAECRDDASCDGDAPACDVSTASCVPCTEDSHCTDASAPFCNAFACVPCLSSDQCTSPTAARCTEAFECAGCQTNDDCASVPGASICNAQQVCVECTDDSHCPNPAGGVFVCHLARSVCTELPAGQTPSCEPCRFDSECLDGRWCVEMGFGNPRTGDDVFVGSYCLPPAVGMACYHLDPPYSTLLDAGARTFCSINHVLTTCPAVRQHLGPIVPCAVDEDCGLGGVCDTAGDNGRCSYLCTADIDCGADGGRCVGALASSPGVCR